jgi:hypothetical protein
MDIGHSIIKTKNMDTTIMASWELKAIIKALSLPVNTFFNTEEDNQRLKEAKEELKKRTIKT